MNSESGELLQRRVSLSAIGMGAPRTRGASVPIPAASIAAAAALPGPARRDSAAVPVSPLSAQHACADERNSASWIDAHPASRPQASPSRGSGGSGGSVPFVAAHGAVAPIALPGQQQQQQQQQAQPRQHVRNRQGGSGGAPPSACSTPQPAPISSPMSGVASPAPHAHSMLGYPSPAAAMPPRSPLVTGAVQNFSLMYATRATGGAGTAGGPMQRAQPLAPLSLSLSRSTSRDALRTPIQAMHSPDSLQLNADPIAASSLPSPQSQTHSLSHTALHQMLRSPSPQPQPSTLPVSPSASSFNASRQRRAAVYDHSKRLTSPPLGSFAPGPGAAVAASASASAAASVAASGGAVATPARRDSMSVALARAHLGAAAASPEQQQLQQVGTKPCPVATLGALPSLQRLSSPQPSYGRSALFPASPHMGPIMVGFSSPHFTAVASPLPLATLAAGRVSRAGSVALPPLAPASLPATPGPMHAPPDLDLETDVLGGGGGGSGAGSSVAAALLSFHLPRPVVAPMPAPEERAFSLHALAAPVAQRPSAAASILSSSSSVFPASSPPPASASAAPVPASLRDQPVGTGVLLTHTLLSRWRPVSPDVVIDPRELAAAQNIIDDLDEAAGPGATPVAAAAAAAVDCSAVANLSPQPQPRQQQPFSAQFAGAPDIDGCFSSGGCGDEDDDDYDECTDTDEPDLRSPRTDPTGLDLRSPRPLQALSYAHMAAAVGVPPALGLSQAQAQAHGHHSFPAHIHPHTFLRGSAYTAHGLPPVPVVVPPLELSALEQHGGAAAAGGAGLDALASPTSSLASPSSTQHHSDSYRAGTAPPAMQLLRPVQAGHASGGGASEQHSFRLESGMMSGLSIPPSLDPSPRNGGGLDPPVLRGNLALKQQQHQHAVRALGSSSPPPPVVPQASHAAAKHAAGAAQSHLSPSSAAAEQRLLFGQGVERGHSAGVGEMDESDGSRSVCSAASLSSAGSPPSAAAVGADPLLRSFAPTAARGNRAASTGDTVPSHLAHMHAQARGGNRPAGHVRGNASHSGAIKLAVSTRGAGGVHAHPLAAAQSTQSGSLRSSESSSPPSWAGSVGSPPTAGCGSMLLEGDSTNTLAAALRAVTVAASASPPSQLSPVASSSLQSRREGRALALGGVGLGIGLGVGTGGHVPTRALRSNIIPAIPGAFPSY